MREIQRTQTGRARWRLSAAAVSFGEQADGGDEQDDGEDVADPVKRASRPRPAAMKTPRMRMAPRTPQKRTRGWKVCGRSGRRGRAGGRRRGCRWRGTLRWRSRRGTGWRRRRPWCDGEDGEGEGGGDPHDGGGDGVAVLARGARLGREGGEAQREKTSSTASRRRRARWKPIQWLRGVGMLVLMVAGRVSRCDACQATAVRMAGRSEYPTRDRRIDSI